MSVSVVITLDTRRMKKKTGTYPVKLLVTHDRIPQRYQTIHDLTQVEYDSLAAPRVSEKMQKVREELKRIKREAEEAAGKIQPFSFPVFEQRFIANNPLFRQRRRKMKPGHAVATYTAGDEDFDYSEFENRFAIFKDDHSQPGTISVTYFAYIKSLLREGRIGNAINCHNSYRSIISFRGNVRFADITVSYLYQYEQWMLEQDKSKTTIGIYLRALRTIFNEADAAGIIRKSECYPFGRRKYQIPTSRNIKKALELDDIGAIYYYEPCCENERKARDFWLFCYFCNGMNPKDVAFLKYKKIQGGYIIFERAKTERNTRSDPRPITVYITEEIQEIMDRWGNEDKHPNNYVFPILETGQTPLQQFDLVQLFVRFINDWMHKIAQNLGIDKKATTIVSRHSFSTVMKRSGASTEFIQEALGHMDKKTTENYMDSFEKEVKKEFANRLLAFKNPQPDKKQASNSPQDVAITAN